ncbi:MAG TPA: ribokinase [Alphaproteobacteria bacterium]|nr:ribokinase [Alphaproteobacteria bacterium]
MICVFGSLNIDLFFRVNSLPKKGETLLAQSFHTSYGGKGANQAMAAFRFGSEVNLFGAVGDDEFGRLYLAYLEAERFSTNGIWVVDQPTGTASITMSAHGDHTIVVASGANLSAKAQDVPLSILGEDVYVLLQMETNLLENWKLLQRAKQKGCKTIVNLAPYTQLTPDVLRQIDYLVVNETEGASLHRDCLMGFEQLSQQYDLTLVITQGVHGIMCFDKQQQYKVPARSITPVDTTGAGDCFVGIFASALDQGMPLFDALFQATSGASYACLKRGAQASMPSKGQLDLYLLEG